MSAEVIAALVEALERYQLADAYDQPVSARSRRAEASAMADAAIAQARPNPAAVRFRECPDCDGNGSMENGDRCFRCHGRRHIASAGAEA